MRIFSVFWIILIIKVFFSSFIQNPLWTKGLIFVSKYAYNNRMDTQASKIIDEFGGNLELAKLFKISSQAISGWRRAGIPESRMFSLRLLRPDLADRWACLRGTQPKPEPDVGQPKPEQQKEPA